MKCTITGKFLDCEVKVDKEGNPIPYTSVFSGGEVVNIRGLHTELPVGTEMDAYCELKLKEFDGRRYLSINYCQEGDA